MSRLNDSIDRAMHTLKQAREVTGQREKVNGMVAAHDDLYRTLGDFYEMKTKLTEGARQ